VKYKEIPVLDRTRIEELLTGGSAEAIQIALLSAALYDPDGKWSETLCVKYLDDPDLSVKAAAITGLGHVARIHGTLDLNVVLPKLELAEKEPTLAGRVSDVRDDITIFMRRERTPS